jgi:SAM-dependent methyltransferase
MREDADRWNERYSDRLPGEPSPPKGVSALELPAGGLCLDVACGLGEHAVWAALNGFDVIALDASDVAVAATRKFAADHGVGDLVDARVYDLDAGLPEDLEGECALIICERFRDVQLYPQLADALAPDGVLVVTVLSTVGCDREPGPTHAPPGDLSIAFSHLAVEIVSHHEAGGEATLVARRRPST